MRSDDATDDADHQPGQNADSRAEINRFISADVRASYDVYSYRHAAAILKTCFPSELAELEHALREFELTQRDIGMPGGNESIVPKKISKILRPKNWIEERVQGDLIVRKMERRQSAEPVRSEEPQEQVARRLENFIDGHKIDYVKDRVAFDLEWNSKDQTFDRDLYAMRAFHECGLISVGVLLTRSEKLDSVLAQTPRLDRHGDPVEKNGTLQTVMAKYGASTTWMGKLLYRLNSGRHGGCPILAFGITPASVSDWNES